MIKFFRKIRYDLIEKNKTGKYLKYAIGEIILVVIGILIALSINNWNENLKKRKSEQIILQQLNQEFIKNKSDLEYTINGHKKALNALNRFISFFPISLNDTSILDSLNLDFGQMHRVYTFNPSNSIINTVTNNSSIDIITDEELRFLLQSWNGILENHIEDERVMQKHQNEIHSIYIKEKGLSYPYIFKDKRLNLEFITTPEFESRFKLKRATIARFFVNDPDMNNSDLNTLKITIDRIIELTKG
jgi:hypothetical protein